MIGDNRVCERCKTPVIKKNLDQWFFRITRYADELLDFSTIDWPETVKILQTNWIGRSEGATVTFRTEAGDPIEVFTTRPDTLWGATFMVLAPEHPLVERLTTAEQHDAVHEYIHQAARQSDIEREALDKDKTGVFTGGYAINPVNDERMPVWIADYVLMTYGTGAIMAVPAHDQRDFEFARKFELEVRPVILPEGFEKLEAEAMTEAIPAYGEMINSGPLTGTPADRAFDATIAFLKEKGTGEFAVNYRLHDWLISRQRYWGAPIPVVYCEECGIVPVPEDAAAGRAAGGYRVAADRREPAQIPPNLEAHHVPGLRPAGRARDGYDGYLHVLLLVSPALPEPGLCTKVLLNQREYDYWMPVDTYTGGVEHATMHLIYTRFFHKALRDLGITEGHEPMLQLRNQGQILGPDGQRMSKSRGNVIDPDEQVKMYGADTVRAYLMFGYRWSEGGAWNPDNIQGVVRWLNRVWSLAQEVQALEIEGTQPEQGRALERKVHQTIRHVSNDLEQFEFNTVISGLMELTNEIATAKDSGAVSTADCRDALETMLLLMAPATPHIAEELWSRLGKPYSIHNQAWPEFDAELAKEDEITLVVQVNGKVRDKLTVPADIGEDEARELALSSEGAQRFMEGKPPREVIVVPGRLVNIVV